jgi:DNA gyrase/topoisomerase IV subunit A
LTRVRGTLVAARAVWQGAEIFVTSTDGIVIRMATDTISRQKRAATGVKVMDVGKDAAISSFTLVPEEEEDDE